MSSRKRKKNDPRALCAQWYPDDGVDPRDDKRRDAEYDNKPDRKARQLCKQAARAVHLALGALPQAEALSGAYVREARPAPHAGWLCVVIVVSDARRREQVAAIVERFAGRLRAEVAAAISRRRCPELTFEVIVKNVEVDVEGIQDEQEGGDYE